MLLVDAHDPVDAQHLVELNAALDQLSEAGRVATAAVVTGMDSITGAAQMTVTAGGALRMPEGLGDQNIQAAGITVDELDQFVDLIASAADVDEPIPVSANTAPWAQEMDQSGALIPQVSFAEPIDIATAALTTDASVPEVGVTVLAAAALQDEPTVADPVAGRRLERALAADPTLEGLLHG